MLTFTQKHILATIVTALLPYKQLADLLSDETMVTSTSVGLMLSFIRNITDEFPVLSVPEEDIHSPRVKTHTSVTNDLSLERKNH